MTKLSLERRLEKLERQTGGDRAIIINAGDPEPEPRPGERLVVIVDDIPRPRR